jgi:hypothetical protein
MNLDFFTYISQNSHEASNKHNIYNIKKRAIAELTEVALKEHKKYEK